ncbi:DNA repair protein RAD5 [Trichoderma ghanense]|uniref:DNA repair protein RAD5 n=1 Tax=Trichoderma ghanense TaxID=65468 RepID=A0ABY2H0X1_9HYPO
MKVEKDPEEETAPSSHKNIFSRFMNQVTGSTSRDMDMADNAGTATTDEDKGTAASECNGDANIAAAASVCREISTNTCPDGVTVVKYTSAVKLEDAAPEETQGNQGDDAQKAGHAGSSKTFDPNAQQVNGGMTPICSATLAPAGTDDTQQSREHARSMKESSKPEGECGTVDKKTAGDMASKEAAGTMGCDETQETKPTIFSVYVEATKEIDKQSQKEQSSEKKCKEKQSHKRSKSGDHHRESAKRVKTAEASDLNDEGEPTEFSGQGDLAETFDIEQARARIPTNCSISHEHDLKEELKDGKKLAKSKKYTKIMVSTLKKHQLTALSWMVQREKESARPAAGGIIGDEMGLGKTVTSLACIATHRLNKTDRKKKAQATLVIVPSRKIALQWRDEARKHWTEEASESVIIYSPAGDIGPRQYAKQLIVIATYTQVRNQYPRQELMDALDRQYADEPLVHRREFRKEAKELFHIDWFRVILDESHEVTRWNGRTLRACCAIEAQHRWALSGTPILNKPMGEATNTAEIGRVVRYRADEVLPEFYSYATFICCNFIGGRRVFRNDYIFKEATNDYFDTLGSYLMYRRTAGKNLDIPPTTHQELYVEVSAEEEILCNAINAFYKRHQKEYEDCKEKKAMPLFENEHGIEEVEDLMPEQGKGGEKGKESSVRSIQASRQLRLRQVLSHPYCLENFLMSQDHLNESEFRSLLSDLRAVAEKKTVIEQLEADPQWQEHLGMYQTGLDILKERKEVSLGGVFDMNSIMGHLLLQRYVRQSECGAADGHSQVLSRYKCGHIYCSTCSSRLMMERSNLPAEEQTGAIKCTLDDCGQDLLSGQPVTTLEMLAAKARADKSYVEIGKDAIMTTVQPKNESSAFFVASSYLPGVIPPPSSRLTATLAVAMTWLTEAPQDKIIIFTQFIPTLKVLGYLFRTLGVKFVYYSGALPKQKQNHAMNAFQNDPKTMVMISTMKSGGQSHNLTVANRVIIVDLWWNKMAEKQAISRVARMGQTKETFSVRIVTKHTMDDRVMEVQRVKEEAVARMLQDDGHERTEVNDEVLERMFEPKPVEQARAKKRKGVKESVTDMIFKEETPE